MTSSALMRLFFVLGCALGALAVGLGAFAAHGLRNVLAPEALETFEVGVRYHMYHAFALIVAAWAVDRWGGTAPTVAGWSFVLGILLFSGSLYVLALPHPRWVVFITPFGGVAFLVGWVALAWAALRS